MESCYWTPSFHVKHFAIFQFLTFCKSVKQTSALCPKTKSVKQTTAFVSYDKSQWKEPNSFCVLWQKPMNQTQQLCVLSRASDPEPVQQPTALSYNRASATPQQLCVLRSAALQPRVLSKQIDNVTFKAFHSKLCSIQVEETTCPYCNYRKWNILTSSFIVIALIDNYFFLV